MKKIKNLLLQILVTVILIVISFWVGFFVAYRDYYNSRAMSLNIRTNNGYVDNSISEIQFADIYGLLDGTAKKYGLALIKQQAQKTEILLKFDNIPAVVKIGETNKSLETEFRMEVVKTCCNGLEYQPVSKSPDLMKVTLVNQNAILSAKYSTILDYNLDQSEVDRMLFYGQGDNSYKIVKDDVKDWPLSSLNNPAPFFWVNVK